MSADIQKEVTGVVTSIIEKWVKITNYGSLHIAGLNNSQIELIRGLVTQGVVPKEAIETALHTVLCDMGVMAFFEYIRSGGMTAPDHTFHPYAIGYAAKHGALGKDQVRSIVFDHEESIELYIKNSEDLLQKVMKMVLEDELVDKTPVLPSQNASDYDPHPVCDCGC